MSLKPIVLWGHASGPNPWKVAIIFEELGIPYDHKMLDFASLKKEPYESLNPNGRVPTIQDPNTGITVFESGACIDYILETYDKQNALTPIEPQQKWTARSWRDFQMSGQGPYWGQVIYFTRYHDEELPNRHLKKTGTPYLTGDKLVYSDLMWATWNAYLPVLLPDMTDLKPEFPHFAAWWQKVSNRPTVQKLKAAKGEAIKAESH